VAGALTGLLFVGLSVSPERLRGTTASVEHQTIAATAFTALIDALFVSLLGLDPGGNLRVAAFFLGLVGLASSAGLAVRLWKSRGAEAHSRRWPYLLTAIITMYGAQAATALAAADTAAQGAIFVLIMFAVGITRSWELFGLRGGGPLSLLAQRLDNPASAPPDQPGRGQPPA
jgi:Kef-type K+ transport system membrane component KefB